MKNHHNTRILHYLQLAKSPLNRSDFSEHDIEVKVKYCGVNFADLYVRQGLIQNIQFPHVLGLECIGIINKVGSKVASFTVNIAIDCVAEKTYECFTESPISGGATCFMLQW